jgi:hypothetical protein
MRGVEPISNFAGQNACLIRCGSQRNFTIAANVEPNAAVVKPVVGIDLFARRCIEGVQLTMTAGLSRNRLIWQRDSRQTGRSRRLRRGFERHRSERVFRNEFPYLGGVGLAA